jgi:hypothetical protein
MSSNPYKYSTSSSASILNSSSQHQTQLQLQQSTDTDDAKMLSSRVRSNSSSSGQQQQQQQQQQHESINMHSSSNALMRNYNAIYSTLPLNKPTQQQSLHSSNNSSSACLSASSSININNVDALTNLVKMYGVSKRNALMKWCQERIGDYKGVDIKNFSSSWNDGLAFCALMHSFLPHRIDYEQLRRGANPKRNFLAAFQLAQSLGIEQTLNISDMLNQERPEWNSVMNYVTLIYKYFHQQQHSAYSNNNNNSANGSHQQNSDEEKVTLVSSSSGGGCSTSSTSSSSSSSPIRNSSSSILH